MARVFAYGTLQHPPLLEQLLGRCPALRPATLAGWRAAPLRGREYPGLVLGAGPTRGHVFEVAGAELSVLDRFEGSQYDRVEVQVQADDEVIAAWAWRLRDEHAELAGDGEWDLDRFVAHDADAFLGGSQAGEDHQR